MFRCGKEVVAILPIDLTWACHEIDLTSGHECKKYKIYKLHELFTSSSSKSLKTLGSELWQDVKLAKLHFEVTSLNVTWRPDLIWPGVNILHKMRKGWINSYAKLGGASRRRFSAICEKMMGAHMCPPPPGRARVKEKLRIKDRSYHFSTNIGLKCMHAGNEHEYNY